MAHTIGGKLEQSALGLSALLSNWSAQNDGWSEKGDQLRKSMQDKLTAVCSHVLAYTDMRTRIHRSVPSSVRSALVSRSGAQCASSGALAWHGMACGTVSRCIRRQTALVCPRCQPPGLALALQRHRKVSNGTRQVRRRLRGCALGPPVGARLIA